MEPDVGPATSSSSDPSADNHEFLNQIAAGAAGMYERLRGDVVPVEDGSSVHTDSERMDRWFEAAGFTDRDKFERWLLNRFDREDVRSYLGPVTWNRSRDLPGWVRGFSHLMNQIQQFDTELLQGSLPYLDPGDPIPFQEALVPLVEYLHEVLGQKKSFENLFSRRARARVLREFLREQSRNASLVLFRQFDAFRARHRDESTGVSGADPTGKALYDRYVEKLLGGEWKDVFSRFPVMARNLSVRFQQRRAFMEELFQRFREDRDELIDRFGDGTPAGPIKDYEELSDETHHGGKRVVRLGFENGPTVVYKSRPVDGAVLLEEVSGFLNERCSGLQIPSPSVMDRGEYGWQEWIEHDPPERHRLGEYWRKAGELLACLYSLCGKDIIRDNLVVSDTHPYTVDLECLVSPDVKVPPGEAAASLWNKSWRLINDCVLETGLLPRLWRDAGGDVMDLSGLAGRPPRSRFRRRPSWSRVNTNYMEFDWKQPERPASNLPVPGSDPDRPLELPVDPLREGFRTVYRRLDQHAESLGDIVGEFESTPSRVIIYPTYVYQYLLTRSRLPRYLRSGVDRTILFDSRLNQGATRVAARDDWAILDAEHRALTNLDVPCFVMPRNRRNGLHDPTYSSAGSSSVVSTRSGSERVDKRLKRLGQRDRERQLHVIRMSLFQHHSSVTNSGGKSSQGTESSRDREISPVSNRAKLGEEVGRISRRLRRRATRCDGCPLWLTLEPDFAVDRYFLRGTTYDLYSGIAGLLMFFAGSERVLEQPGPAREFSKPLVDHLENLESSRVPDWMGRMGPGGFQGFPSTLYGMATAGQLLARPTLVDEAVRLARAIPESALRKSDEISFVSGLAGGLLVFLKLHDLRQDTFLLERAEACGERILTVGFSRSEDGFRVVKNRKHRSRAGFARGFSGVAWALAQLSERVSSSRYGKAARAALQFDVAQLFPGGDAADAPRDTSHWQKTGWFRGWPPLAVTSNYLEETLDQPGSLLTPRLSERVFEPGGGTGPKVDTLARGRMGEALVYRELSDRPGRDDYGDRANDVLARLVSRSPSPVYRCLPGSDEKLSLPGFMEGLAGLGYGYLVHLDEEGKLPSVLFLE